MPNYEYTYINLPKKYEWERFLDDKDLELINLWCINISYSYNIIYVNLVALLCEKINEALEEQNKTYFDMVHSRDNERYKFVLLVWNKIFHKLHICDACNIDDYMNIIMIYSQWCEKYRIKEMVANDCICQKCIGQTSR